MRFLFQQHFSVYGLLIVSCFAISAQAEILTQAELVMKIGLANKSTTRPMTVAYNPIQKKYYIADGGLAPMGSEFEPPISKSEVHTYDASGKYISSAKPGYDNRSIYFNSKEKRLETITYNVSSELGFAPNTGTYALDLNENGEVKNSSKELSQYNTAFGFAGTMPSFDVENNRYFAKQGRSNMVFIVDPKTEQRLGHIALDFTAAGVAHDDISDGFVAYSDIQGEELLLLDVDHKAILVFDIHGKYVNKSELPKTMKLRAHNHYNGLGYANDLFFVFNEPEGEFGTYYGFKVQKK